MLEAKEMSFSFVLIMSSPNTIVVCTPLGQALGLYLIFAHFCSWNEFYCGLAKFKLLNSHYILIFLNMQVKKLTSIFNPNGVAQHCLGAQKNHSFQSQAS
jgi:hypothetical protein